jgi:hypothetical protein
MCEHTSGILFINILASIILVKLFVVWCKGVVFDAAQVGST